MTAYYVHDLNPILIRFTDTLAVRWYGLAYVAGALLAVLLLRRLARRGYGVLKSEEVSDFVTYAFIFGVFLGGRLGYMLLYDLEYFLANPLSFFKILSGGMASHGGIAGLMVFTFYYAKRHQRSWTGLGDCLVVVAPIGLCLGRLANFINGELYGRITDVAWAVIFPKMLYERGHTPETNLPLWDGIFSRAPELTQVPRNLLLEKTVDLARTHEGLQTYLAEQIAPRHPSQLYQAGLEGLLLFLILLTVRLRWKHLPNGVLTGLFFILYAVFRIVAEQFREPDASLIAGLPRGQFYSIFMIGIGAFFLIAAWKKRRRQEMNAA